jgi:hypothetical protein
MGQLGLFSAAQLAVMRDPTARRNYSAEAEEFRREHKRHRDWGLKRRYAEKARRAGGGHNGSREQSVTVRDSSPPAASASAATPSLASAGQTAIRPPATAQAMTRQRPAGEALAAPDSAQQCADGRSEPKAVVAEPGVVILTLSQREEISPRPTETLSYKQIGVLLGRVPSIVSRKVGCHGDLAGRPAHRSGPRRKPQPRTREPRYLDGRPPRCEAGPSWDMARAT